MLETDAPIGGKYRLVRSIASGGMGTVHEAVHIHTRGRVAIKILSEEAKRDEASRARFAREARASGRLRSRHVARVLDVDALADGTPYLVMEYLEGRDLSQTVKERGALPLAEVASILVQVCAGVGEAHAAGIVHRDLKPGNVFLAESGASRIAKVLDFGIAKVPSEGDDEELTRTFSTMGTPGYMSPEQIRAPKDVDSATDVWAIGVLLYRLLTASLPFTGNSSSVAVAICHDEPAPIALPLPREILDLIAATLRKARAERPSIREVAAVLAAHTSDPIAADARAELEALNLPDRPLLLPTSTEPTLAATERSMGEAPRTRSPGLRFAFAVLALALLGGGVFMATRDRQAPAPTPSSPANMPPEPMPIPVPMPIVVLPPAAPPVPSATASVSASAHASAKHAPIPHPKTKPSSTSNATIPPRL